MNILVGIRTDEVLAIETNVVLINLVRFVYLEQILKILSRTTQDICIFEVFKHGRHQLYSLSHVIASEIHIIVYYCPVFLSLIHHFLHLVAQ